MPVLTPNFALPVPGPLDEPCDFPEQWCGFTDAVQAVLDTFETVANRTNPWVPLAQMRLTTSVVLVPQSNVPFDTLVLNNAGMIDFDTNRTTITINRPGRFLSVLNTLSTFDPIANVWQYLQFQPTGGFAINRTPSLNAKLSQINGVDIGSTLTAVFHVTTPPVNVRVIIDWLSVTQTITVDAATLSLFWFADRGAP